MEIVPVTVAFHLPIQVQCITFFSTVKAWENVLVFPPTFWCHSMSVFAACYCFSSSVSGICLPCGSYFAHLAWTLIPVWSGPPRWWPQSGLDVGFPWAVKLIQWILASFLSVLLWVSLGTSMLRSNLYIADAFIMSSSLMGIEVHWAIVLSLYNLLVL